MSDEVRVARERRADALGGQRQSIPFGDALRLNLPYGAELRTEPAEDDDEKRALVTGYASVTDRGYEMWDVFGPYEEKVASGAFDWTLSRDPDVNFVVNHGGLSMARTGSNSLKLRADMTGLNTQALVNPQRSDVADLLHAIGDGDITEMSFKFRIDSAEWSEDFSAFVIKRVDLDRGDVSAVNFGASPHTSISAEARAFMRSLDRVPPAVARAALARLQARADLGASRPAPAEAPAAAEPPRMGRSTALIMAQLLADEA